MYGGVTVLGARTIRKWAAGRSVRTAQTSHPQLCQRLGHLACAELLPLDCIAKALTEGHVFTDLSSPTLNIPRAGRVGAHGGAAGRRRSGLGADRTVRPGDKRPSHPPRHREHIA